MKRVQRQRLQPPALLETAVAAIADYDVIQHSDTEELAGGDKASREVEIVNRRVKTAAEMGPGYFYERQIVHGPVESG